MGDMRSEKLVALTVGLLLLIHPNYLPSRFVRGVAGMEAIGKGVSGLGGKMLLEEGERLPADPQVRDIFVLGLGLRLGSNFQPNLSRFPQRPPLNGGQAEFLSDIPP